MDEGVLHVPAMQTFGFENYSVRGRSHAPSAARSLHRAKRFVTSTWETRHTVWRLQGQEDLMIRRTCGPRPSVCCTYLPSDLMLPVTRSLRLKVQGILSCTTDETWGSCHHRIHRISRSRQRKQARGGKGGLVPLSVDCKVCAQLVRTNGQKVTRKLIP